MISLIGWLAALVATLTSLAMLQDASMRPDESNPHGRFRHILRLVLLVGTAASSAVLLVFGEARQASIYEVALRCCLAGYLAMQSPCPWLSYVLKGRGPFIEQRRGSSGDKARV